MSDSLLIHYNPKYATLATWSTVNTTGELTSRITHGALSEINTGNTREVIVLLHSQYLHINQLQLPAMNMQKTMKAVPFAIEEYIAQDIEDFHLVVTREKRGNLTSVAGIERELLKNILAVFNEHNIRIDKLLPDALCLPVETRQWACLQFEDDCYLQTQLHQGLVCACNLLPYVLREQLDKHRTAEPEQSALPEKILFFSEQDTDNELPSIDALPDDAAIEPVKVKYNQHPLVIFCGHYRQAEPLNLLQNEFKPRSKSSSYWSQWKLAASLAAVWLVLNLSVAGYEYSQLSSQNRELEQQIIATYKKTFPESKRIINPLAQMKQKLSELQSGASGNNQGLLFLLAAAFGENKVNDQDITLQSLAFRNNKIDLSLESTNLQAIQNLNNMLNSSDKIRSEITSSTAEKDKVRGNLRIEARG
jgi:general secretion pathway protein L